MRFRGQGVNGEGGFRGQGGSGERGKNIPVCKGREKTDGDKKGKGVPACTTALENTNDITCV